MQQTGSISSPMKDTTLNMTTGNPVRLLIVFSIPMLIGNLFQQCYNLADSVIVGQLVGAQALAAIGTTSSITFFFFALANGFGSGGGIIVSQAFGKGNEAEVKNSIANTAYVMFLVPLIIGTTAFFISRPLLIILKTPDDIFKDAANGNYTLKNVPDGFEQIPFDKIGRY